MGGKNSKEGDQNDAAKAEEGKAGEERERPGRQSSPTAWDDKEKGGESASSAAVVAKDEKKEKEKKELPSRLPGDPHRIEFVEESDDEDEDEEKPKDPAFYLGSATVIGMCCFCTFMFKFIGDYGQLNSKNDQLVILLVTFIGGFVTFLVPFVYYAVTSKHHVKCCGQLLDGLLGGLPFLPNGCGVFFIYCVLGIALRQVTRRGTPLDDKLLLWFCIPPFMIAFIPLYLFLLRLQNQDAAKAAEEKAEERKKKGKRPQPELGKNPWKVSLVVFRRLLMAGVVSCCGAAYAVLPLFGLAYACIGMKELWEIHIAIPLSILGVLLIFVIVCAIFARIVLKTIALFFYNYYTLPILGWSPRSDSFLPKYDNSLTLDRRLARHNDKVEKMEALRRDGKKEEADELAEEIRVERQKIQAEGAIVKERKPPPPDEKKKKEEEDEKKKKTGGAAGGAHSSPRAGRANDVDNADVESIESI